MSWDAKETSADLDRWSEALSWRETFSEGREEDLTSAVGRRWQDWYADPENRRTFEAVNGLLAERDRYGNLRRPSKAELDADDYDVSVPIAVWKKKQIKRRADGQANKPANRQALNDKKSPQAGRLTSRWAFGGIVVAAAAVLVALVPLGPMRFWAGGGLNVPALYQTGTGELKDVHLLDGSTIVMGAKTKLTVAYSSKRRVVNLFEGQAWFKAVHNPRWPFVVRAGDGTITAAGTAFVVTRYSDRVVVAVTEGTVVVKANQPVTPGQPFDQAGVPKPPLTPVHVTQGNQLVFRENGSVSPIKPTDTRVATAWTQGRLIFDDQPLSEVVEAVNRYSTQPIIVSPEAGNLRFGGVVHDDEIKDWLKSLQAIFPVTVEERAGSTYIRMRHTRSDTHKLPLKTQR